MIRTFLIFVFFSIKVHSAQELLADYQCFFPECLETNITDNIDFGKAYEAMNKDGKQHQKIKISIMGGLSKQDKQKFDLTVNTFIGGMTDSISLPILGFYNNGDLIIKTKKGPFYLKDKSFNLSCEKCIKFVESNSGKVLKEFNITEEAWRMNITHFRFDNELKLYYLKDKECIEIDMNSLYKKLPIDNCRKKVSSKDFKLAEPTPKEYGPPKKVKFIPALKRQSFFELYKSDLLDYLIYAATNVPADT